MLKLNNAIYGSLLYDPVAIQTPPDAQFGSVWKPYWSDPVFRTHHRACRGCRPDPVKAAPETTNGLLFRKSWKRRRLGGNDLIEVLLKIFGCEMGQKNS
jgi:hypothetical protein